MAHYVMGDIHGEADRFHAMLKIIQFSEDDILILLGDVIDRGPDGISLLLEIMEMPNVIMVLGNHEFDNGVDTLAVVLRDAKFPIVCANYDVTGSVLERIVQPYTIIRRANVRIGVFGIGVNPQGLIADRNFYPLQYLDPITTAQEVANTLKNEKNCDIVICLIHQGTHPGGDGKLSDIELAQDTRNIDIIICAHSHKIVENLYIPNVDGDSV